MGVLIQVPWELLGQVLVGLWEMILWDREWVLEGLWEWGSKEVMDMI